MPRSRILHTGIKIGLALCESLESPGKGVHAAHSDDPGDDRAERTGGIAKGARQGKDSRPHHGPDNHPGQGKE
jgi:hypothetical protein